MNDGKITVRYARALFDLSSEKKVLEKVYNDMNALTTVLKESSELKTLLGNPVVPVSKKIELSNSIFASFDKISKSFIHLMITNRREHFLGHVARYFIKLYRQSKGIGEAIIETAVALDEKIITQIKNAVKGTYNEILLDNKVNASIIGGFLLQFNDVQFDASVASKLKKIKQEFDNTTIK